MVLLGFGFWEKKRNEQSISDAFEVRNPGRVRHLKWAGVGLGERRTFK